MESIIEYRCAGGAHVDVRDLTHDLRSREWQEFAEACCCHDNSEPIVSHSLDLLCGTAATSGEIIDG